jgi:hypothetical protein
MLTLVVLFEYYSTFVPHLETHQTNLLLENLEIIFNLFFLSKKVKEF